MTGLRKRGVFDAGEDHELGLAVGYLCKEERAAGLGDRFDHENTGHDGVVGKMAGEVGLVDGDVFDGDDAVAGLHLDDSIDEEEGVAVGEEGHDFEDVHGFGRGGLGFGGWGGLGGEFSLGVGHGMDEYKRPVARGTPRATMKASHPFR